MIAFSDSDWAGCKTSRRSVSGGMLVIDGCALKCWSNRQVTVALSSGEAELYAATKAVAELFGFESLMADMNWKVEPVPELWMDSNAARGMVGRRGLGKTRHIDVRRLWLQEALEAKRLVTKKVSGASNPPDVLTKLKSFRETSALIGLVNLLFV